jgi:hypothetical protein
MDDVREGLIAQMIGKRFEELVSDLEVMKADGGVRARNYAILLTDAEKQLAYFREFILRPLGVGE